MKLLIAIPALNEEASIENIIQRSLQARDPICRHSSVSHVGITVVSDGSTDRTVEIASQYRDQIDLIIFPQYRGYGAAIKEAWHRSDAEVLGFLDADGTCDPRFFAKLCERLGAENADVALGCRLNEESQMPSIRRVGNMLFAMILTAFSSGRIRDTASGMRIVRRSSKSRAKGRLWRKGNFAVPLMRNLLSCRPPLVHEAAAPEQNLESHEKRSIRHSRFAWSHHALGGSTRGPV